MSDRGSFDLLFGQTGPRYQTWPERAVREVGSDIYSLMHPPIETREQIAEGAAPAFRTAATLATAGYPGAESGAVGIFGGRLAKNAPLDMLRSAERFETAGSSPAEIWKATGWARGKDNKWRFEIPDEASAMNLKPGELDPKWTGRGSSFGTEYPVTTVGKAMEHPELFDAYPDLSNLQLSRETNSRYLGSYVPGRIKITSDTDKSTLLHELQHAVQRKEGFERGANPKEFEFNPDLGMAHRAGETAYLIQQRINALTEKGGNQAEIDGLRSALAKLASFRTTKRMQGDPLGMYRRVAGETEARNVQTRHAFTPELRASYPPESTEDIPRLSQILRDALDK